MTWLRPRDGDKRVRRGFLLLPKTCYNEDGRNEIRWLCFASWEQEYSHQYGWTDYRWLS